MQEQILRLAQGITGAGEDDQALLKALCTAAETAWAARLKEGASAETCSEAFGCAVAFTASADFLISKSGEQVSSFTAGEISVKNKEGTNAATSAAALRQTAERLMVPYAEAVGFAFKGVRG